MDFAPQPTEFAALRLAERGRRRRPTGAHPIPQRGRRDAELARDRRHRVGGGAHTADRFGLKLGGIRGASTLSHRALLGALCAIWVSTESTQRQSTKKSFVIFVFFVARDS